MRVRWCIAILLLASCQGRGSGRPRSIVLVTIDALRADSLGSYGGRSPTPVLDSLAHDGTRFQNVYAQSPLTLASHSSILTGTYPTFHGVRDNVRSRLPAEAETLAEILKEHGYRTAAFVGGFPVDSTSGLDQGFDLYDDSLRSVHAGSFAERRASDVLSPARSWIESAGENPHFLWVHLFDPHAPYDPPDPYPHDYLGEVAYVDAALKDFLLAVPRDAVVAVTADHGEGLGEHGESTHSFFLYESTLRVPLLLRGPAVPARTVVEEPARSIDLLPTILELAGIESCARCQGRSLVPALAGEDLPPEPSYAETYFPRLRLGGSELRSLRSGGWKYIEAPEPELYEIDADPGENRNLAAANPDRFREMASELHRLEEETARAGSAERALDRETRRMLQALGYRSESPSETPGRARPDPKDLIQAWEGVRRGMSLLAEGDTDGAIEDLERSLRVKPDLLLARSQLALAYFERGRYPDSVEQCRGILAREPSDFDGTLLLGRVLLRAGRGAEARLVLERAASLDDSSPEPWAELAQLHSLSGFPSEAEAAFKKASERDAGTPSVLLAQGKLALAAGSIPYAEKLFRAAIEAAPSGLEPRIQLGELLLTQRRLEEAEEHYRVSLDFRPQSSELHLGLGRTLSLEGRRDEGIASFERALELSPSSTLALNSLGVAYLDSGQSSKGQELLKRSLEIQPDQPELTRYLKPSR